MMSNKTREFEQLFKSETDLECKLEFEKGGNIMHNITYNILQNIFSRECYYIVLTDISSRIMRIISPHYKTNDESIEYSNSTAEIYTIDSIKCLNNDGKYHLINDIYNPDECCNKCPNDVKKFTDASDVLKYIANIYHSGNPGLWAGNALRIDADEDLEFYGVYQDESTGKMYGGWIATHQTGHLPKPRTVKFNTNDDINDTIDVLLEYDCETENGLKISYKDHIAYSNRDLTEHIYERIWHLLHIL